MRSKAAQMASWGAGSEVQVKCPGGLGSPDDRPGYEQSLRELLKITRRLEEADFW